jgi:hypothetical protein
MGQIDSDTDLDSSDGDGEGAEGADDQAEAEVEVEALPAAANRRAPGSPSRDPSPVEDPQGQPPERYQPADDNRYATTSPNQTRPQRGLMPSCTISLPPLVDVQIG